MAQIECFKKRLGRPPAYLDGHQHQHVTPENIDRVIQAAKRYRLPIRSRLPADRLALKQSGVNTPDNFVSWHPARLPVLAERLDKSQTFPISELVVHPGYYDARCLYPYNQEREAELAFLRSPNFQELVQPFRLVGYTYLNDSAHYVRAAGTTATRKKDR